MRGVGKRGGTAYLFRLGDDLINFGALHQLLAASVPEMMPVVVTELLVDGAQKTGGNPVVSVVPVVPAVPAVPVVCHSYL